jgi:predicted nuclease of predicted toxin-antitoxin system
MRILADENFPLVAVEALQKQGHDVIWIRTDAPGSIDRVILARAQAENLVIVTFDKDFGELAFRFNLPALNGIILFRITPSSPERIAEVVVAVLATDTDFAGNFTVVEDDRIRIKPLGNL